MQYLIEATNQIWDVLSSAIEPSREDLQKVLVKACITLKKASSDEKLFHDFKTLYDKKVDHEKEYHKIVDNFENFVEHLALEKALLLKYNISEKAANALLDQAKKLHEVISHWDGDLEALKQNLTKVRDTVCDAAEHIKKAADAEANKGWWKSAAIKGFKAIGGVGLIAVDASADAATLGATGGTVTALVSGAAGTALVGDAVTS